MANKFYALAYGRKDGDRMATEKMPMKAVCVLHNGDEWRVAHRAPRSRKTVVGFSFNEEYGDCSVHLTGGTVVRLMRRHITSIELEPVE